MKSSRWFAFVVVALLCLMPVVFAGEEHRHAEAAMPEMGPPKELDQIKFQLGTWDVSSKYLSDPSAEWQEAPATCTFSLAAGGAAMMMDYKSEMMGMPFQGIGLTCYNRETKKWQTAWTDNMGALISLYEGTYEGKKFVVGGDRSLARAVVSFAVND